jgi:monoamine oxidase
MASDAKPVGSYPPTGIDVLVVGTGLAGLTAAIECTRKGHSVRVLERNSTINTAGERRNSGYEPRSRANSLGCRRYVLHGPQCHEILQALAGDEGGV